MGVPSNDSQRHRGMQYGVYLQNYRILHVPLEILVLILKFFDHSISEVEANTLLPL